MPFTHLCPVPCPRSSLEHKLLSFQHPTCLCSEHRWHFLCSSLSPIPRFFSLEYSSSELPLRGLPFCSTTQNSLHSPTLTCYLPSLLLDSPEDFGARYCLPPSSHPAITLSYCREREPPVRTWTHFLHLLPCISEHLPLTGQQGLPPRGCRAPSLKCRCFLTTTISLPRFLSHPLTPGPTKTSIFSTTARLLVCTIPSLSPGFILPTLTTVSQYQIPVAAVTKYHRMNAKDRNLFSRGSGSNSLSQGTPGPHPPEGPETE